MVPTLKRLFDTKTFWTGILTIIAAVAAGMADMLPGEWDLQAIIAIILAELHIFNGRDTKAKEANAAIAHAFVSSGTSQHSNWTTPVGQWLMYELKKRFNGGLLGTVLSLVAPMLSEYAPEQLQATGVDIKREIWARVTRLLRAAGIVPNISIPVKSIVMIVALVTLLPLSGCLPVAELVWPVSPEPDRMESYILGDATTETISIADELVFPVLDDEGVLIRAVDSPLYRVIAYIEGDGVIFNDERDQCVSTLFGGGYYCVLENIPANMYLFLEMTCTECSVRLEHALVEGGVRYSKFVDGLDVFIPPS